MLRRTSRRAGPPLREP